VRLFVLILALVASAAARADAAAPWLFVSDVHYEPRIHTRGPSRIGADTNLPLLRSAIAEMRRVDPHPPVVVIPGDFLSHAFAPSSAAPTIVALAQAFDRAFPDAQFVIALGNNDSSCGDYHFAPDSAFLRTFAHAWAPLVNRRGAAPQFARTFPHDGYYVARLPLAGVRAVVIDDVFWSPRYRPCGRETNPGAQALGRLRSALRAGAPMRNWVLVHIPPGIDTFSTVAVGHRTVVVPLLDPGPREALEGLVNDRTNRVSLLIAGHIHRFTYRLVGDGEVEVPLLIVPAISPIFGNAPSFLTVDVAPDGTIRGAEERSFVENVWHDEGGLRSLGMTAFTTSQILALQRRLSAEPALRATYARLYEGDGRKEITDRNWRFYWCASTELAATPYRACIGVGGFSIFTTRGIVLISVGLILLIAVATAGAVVLVRATRLSRRAL
jgi:sphingomyelin phosphodiesterase acid-like 3